MVRCGKAVTPETGPSLGLCAFVHDSSAALAVDGRLAGFVEEERLSGVKHTKSYPFHAVGSLLHDASLRPEHVRAVALTFDGPEILRGTARALARADGRRPVRSARGVASYGRLFTNLRRRLAYVSTCFPQARVTTVPHHRCHADYAFAAVVTIDSIGESRTTSVELHRRWEEPRRLLSEFHTDSLGYAYGAVTEHLGYRRGDEEGTVMALAALGDASRFRELFRQAIRLTDLSFRLDPDLFLVRVFSSAFPRLSDRFVAATCPRRAPGEPLDQVHADLAAALQERTGEVFLHLAEMAAASSRQKRAIFTGGVALNCVAVGRVLDAGIFDEVFVPPAPGDSGTSLGAVVNLAGGALGGIARACYLGPEPDRDALVRQARDAGLEFCRPETLASHVAQRLSRGEIVGIFRGRAEAGPRALGNRSILASPLADGVVDRLLTEVKKREPFRPFAPAVPLSVAGDWFHLGQPSPFMSIAVRAKPKTRQAVPAIVHVDGSARVQTVDPTGNEFLHEVLTTFGEATGIPLLINTSLNAKGQPTSGTAEAAIRCLRESALDALVLGDVVAWEPRP